MKLIGSKSSIVTFLKNFLAIQKKKIPSLLLLKSKITAYILTVHTSS